MDAAPTSTSTSSATTLDDATIKASDLAQRGLTYYTPRPWADQSIPDAPDASAPDPWDAWKIPNAPLNAAPSYETLPNITSPSSADPGAALTLLTAPSSSGPDASPAPADPVSRAQQDYQAARQVAGQSMLDTRQKLGYLGFSVPDDALADPAALHSAIQARINAALADSSANQSSPFGPTRLTPQSQLLRDNLADLSNRAASIVSDHADTLDDLRRSYSALSTSRLAAAGPPTAASSDQGSTSRLAAAGPPATATPDQGSASQGPPPPATAQSQPDAVSSASLPTPAWPQPAASPAPAIPGLDHSSSAGLDNLRAGQGIADAIANDSLTKNPPTNNSQTNGPVTNTAVTPSNAPTPSAASAAPSPPPAPFQPTDAPYRLETNGSISFDPKRLTDGVRAAFQAGQIDQDKFNALLPKAQAAEKAMQEQQQLVETNPVARRLMALGHGATTGAAFLAGAPVGAEAGAAIGAFFGPADVVTVPLGAAIGGAITGGIASWGANKILHKLGEYSDTVKAFNDAAEAHPYYDAAGNLISFGAGLPKAVTGVAATGLSALAGEGESLAARGLRGAANAYEKGSPGVVQSFENFGKDWANRAGASFGTKAAGLGARVAQGAAANVAIDTTIKEGARALGLSDEGQTLSGAVQAALIGGIMAGHGITVNDIPHEVASEVTTRGYLRDQYGLGSRDALSDAEIAARFPGVDAVTAQALRRPLNPGEREIYNSVATQMKAALDRGETLGTDPQITARQALTGGKPYGNTSVEITPTSGPRGGSSAGAPMPETAPLPQTPGLSSPPAPSAPRSPSPAGPRDVAPTTGPASTSGSSLSDTPASSSRQDTPSSPDPDATPSAAPAGGTSPAPDAATALRQRIADAQAQQEQAKRDGNSLAVAMHGLDLAQARRQLAALPASRLSNAGAPPAAPLIPQPAGSDTRPAAETTSPTGGAVSPAPSSRDPAAPGAATAKASPPAPAIPVTSVTSERPWGVTEADRGTRVESRNGITGTLGDANSQKAAIRDANGNDHLFDAADVRPAAPNVPRGTAAKPNTAAQPGPWGEVTDAHRGLPIETRDGRTGTLAAGPLPNTPNPNVAIRDAQGTLREVPLADTRLAGSAGGDAPSPESSATVPNTSANPNTAPAKPGPWGEVTDAHRGLAIETQDGRTGTLEAGPLPNTPNPNVAIRDVQGKLQTVPQAETRLAGSVGGSRLSEPTGKASSSANPAMPHVEMSGNRAAVVEPDGHISATFETPAAARQALRDRLSSGTFEERAYLLGPRDPDEGWGEVGANDIGRDIETRDGRKGTVVGYGANRFWFKSGEGNPQLEDFENVRFYQPEDAWFADHVAKEVDLAHSEYDPLFQQVGVTPNRDANAGVNAMVNSNWNPNDPNSSPVKVNLSKKDVSDHVLAKSRDNEEVAQIVARATPAEEYTHAIDILDDSQEFLRSPERARGVKWNSYRKLQQHLTVADIIDAVDRLQANPEKQQEAIQTLETLFRSYKMAHDPNHPDYQKMSWPEIIKDPEKRRVLVGEAVRQLAQYAESEDTSELGYLKPLDENRYNVQKAFYEKALRQLNEGMFGNRLRNKVNKVVAEIKNLKTLRDGQ
ncbi:hypothetical protein [Chthoniobacter flavus]|nr:hypothetical protein [Chthoniobacter flavus]